jgi:hypothetical protein
MVGPLSIVRLRALVLRRKLPIRSFTVSSGLPIGKRVLSTLLIDVHLKLAEFQT